MSATDLEVQLDSLIVEVCSPIFSLLIPLQTAELADCAPSDLREQVEKSFVMLERRCFECQVSPERIRDIKYAMSAFSDEIVLSSRWEQKYEWMAKPLAVEYFGDSSIGQTFFDRLNELRLDIKENSELVHLFFSVLNLGFQGKYRLEGYEQLQAYISTLRTDIEKYSGVVNRVLSDNASPESHISSRIAGHQPYWVMAVILVASLLIMTIYYSQQIRSAIAESAESIESLEIPENFGSPQLTPLEERTEEVAS
ncbi:type IVB secretion system protein IcmH/DotU [Reinekea forsetii]|nr:type IVB secretion system protein IcmH/DotU [Reinekea forsetii]